MKNNQPTPEHTIIAEMKFGSHLYGLNTEKSDVDWKVIFLPSMRELVFGATHNYVYRTAEDNTKNTSDDVDIDKISLQKFVMDALSGQTYTIDMLHCNQPTKTSVLWDTLVANRKKLYTKKVTAYLVYLRQQAAKYGIKGSRLSDIKRAIESLQSHPQDKTIGEVADTLYVGQYAKIVSITNEHTGVTESYYDVNDKKYQFTNKISYAVERLTMMFDNYGQRAKQAMVNDNVDWKAVSHAFRAGYQLKHILDEGDFEYPLPETSFILDVKQGKIPFDEVSPMLSKLVDEITEKAKNSDLPDEPDEEFFYNLVYNVYSV